MSLFFNKRRISRKTGNKKLDEDFVYTQKHKNIWNSFCNFLDERFAEEDMMSEILDADEIFGLKILPTIPGLLEFIPTNVGDEESDEDKRRRIMFNLCVNFAFCLWLILLFNC